MKTVFRSLIILITALLASHHALSSQQRTDLQIQKNLACQAAASRIELPPVLEEMHDLFMRRFAMKQSWTGPHDVTQRWMTTTTAEKNEIQKYIQAYEINRIAFPTKIVKRVLDMIMSYEEVLKSWNDEKLAKARQNPKAFFEQVYVAHAGRANIANKIEFSELMEFFILVQSLMKNPEVLFAKANIGDQRVAYLPEDAVSHEVVGESALRAYFAEHKKISDDFFITFHGSTVNGRGVRKVSDIDHATSGTGSNAHSDALAGMIFRSEKFKSFIAKLGVQEVETHDPNSGAMSPLQVDVHPDALRLYLLLPVYEQSGFEKPVRVYIGEL